MSARQSLELPPALEARYQILAPLGEGSFGRVVAARRSKVTIQWSAPSPTSPRGPAGRGRDPGCDGSPGTRAMTGRGVGTDG